MRQFKPVSKELIKGVQTKQLKVIADERGHLMEILRKDDPLFEEFGQVYMTAVHPNVTKAWHYHKRQTDHFVVVQGMIKLALYDMRHIMGFGKEKPHEDSTRCDRCDGWIVPPIWACNSCGWEESVKDFRRNLGMVNEFFIGVANPMLVKIPPGVLHGFKGIGTETAIVINTTTKLYEYKNPDEYRIDPHTNRIPYSWARSDAASIQDRPKQGHRNNLKLL